MAYADTDAVMRMFSEGECDLTPHERVIYFALAHHRNGESGLCFPGVALLEKETGLARSSVQKCLKSLKAKVLLSWENTWKTENQRSSNRYTLLIPEEWYTGRRARGSPADGLHVYREASYPSPEDGNKSGTKTGNIKEGNRTENTSGFDPQDLKTVGETPTYPRTTTAKTKTTTTGEVAPVLIGGPAPRANQSSDFDPLTFAERIGNYSGEFVHEVLVERLTNRKDPFWRGKILTRTTLEKKIETLVKQHQAALECEVIEKEIEAKKDKRLTHQKMESPADYDRNLWRPQDDDEEPFDVPTSREPKRSALEQLEDVEDL